MQRRVTRDRSGAPRALVLPWVGGVCDGRGSRLAQQAATGGLTRNGPADVAELARGIGLVYRADLFATPLQDVPLTSPSANHFPDVVEARRRPRFGVPAHVRARFNGAPVTLLDIAAGGLQLEHSGALRVGLVGNVAIDGEEHFELRARVVWSRFFGGSAQQNLYRSGLSFEALDAVAGKLGRFIRAYGRPDEGSLARKSERLAARRGSRPPVLHVTRSQANTSDERMMIQQARQRLASAPDEALKWYNRAKFALTERADIAAELSSVSHRQEVLAVWEYLQRRIPISAIVRAFAGK